jgi:hypothetical protein
VETLPQQVQPAKSAPSDVAPVATGYSEIDAMAPPALRAGTDK